MIENLPEGRRPEQMDVPHFEHPFLFKYLTHPRVLKVIERFIGPDIVLWSSHFISKREHDGMAVPWHQDGVYWGKSLDPMHVITMWLAVDESKVENGCMRVIAGSHNQRDRRYEEVDRTNNLFGSEVVESDLDASKVVNWNWKLASVTFTTHGRSITPVRTSHRNGDVAIQCATCQRVSAIRVQSGVVNIIFTYCKAKIEQTVLIPTHLYRNSDSGIVPVEGKKNINQNA